MVSTTSTTRDADLDAMLLGKVAVRAFGGELAYEPTGGKCKHDGCDEDAARVKIGRNVVALPCPSHAAEEAATLAADERAAAAAACLADSGLTPRQREFSFESYREVFGDEAGLAALAVVERWHKTYLDTGTGSNLLLWGKVGSGKTGLASALVRSLCESGRQAKIVNFKNLLEAIKDCYARRVPTTHAMECHRAPVLVLDDLGSEKPTAFACGELLGIVDHRYERGMPTIYISNYGPADLSRRLGRDDLVIGQRITSRMREGAVIHEFTAADHRRARSSNAR